MKSNVKHYPVVIVILSVRGRGLQQSYIKMLGVPSFPALNSPQRQNNQNKKVALKPGRSLMDWIAFTPDNKYFQGFGGPVTFEELGKHNTEKDCWVAIRGRYIISYFQGLL